MRRRTGMEHEPFLTLLVVVFFFCSSPSPASPEEALCREGSGGPPRSCFSHAARAEMARVLAYTSSPSCRPLHTFVPARLTRSAD